MALFVNVVSAMITDDLRIFRHCCISETKNKLNIPFEVLVIRVDIERRKKDIRYSYFAAGRRSWVGRTGSRNRREYWRTSPLEQKSN